MFGTPDWFLPAEILFNIIIAAVCGAVTIIGFRAGRFLKSERHRLHSTGFLLLSGAYTLMFLTNILLFFETRHATYSLREIAKIFHLIWVGHLVFALLLLAGLAYLLFMHLDIRDRWTRALLLTIIVFATLLSHHSTTAFFLLITMLMGFIIAKLARVYSSHRTLAGALVMGGFCGVLLGEALMAMLFVSPALYVLAVVVTVMGFLAILASLVVRN